MIKNLGISTTSRLIWSVSIAVALLLIGYATFAIQHTAHAQTGTGGHLITIHDRGVDKVLLTNADTVGDALTEAQITLDSHDAVEPVVSQKLIATEYQVNIYRARPVTVIDGPTRAKIVTAYQTAEQIAKDAGISLYPEDKTTLSRSDNLLADGAGLSLTIDRATLFNFTLYGTSSPTRTQGKTVGDMLAEKGITLGADDRVSVPLITIMTEGLQVQLWREGKQTITVEEDVAFGTTQIRDADRAANYKAVQSTGVIGKRNATYEVEIRDGQEVARTEIASIVTTQPVGQVEVIGTKPAFLPYTGGGTKTEWLAASNVPQESWGYADYMVAKESGWNPNARNASSGACGLAQALPCSKVPGDPLNPIDSLNWMNSYVNGRYGGWQGAYNFWQANHWY